MRQKSKKSSSFNSCVEVLQNCEGLLGVYNVQDGVSSEFLPIQDYLVRVLGIKMSRDELKVLATKCGYYMTSLAYTRSNCSFRRISVLNFSEHNRIDLLCNLLIPFLKRENVNSLVMGNNEYLIKYLTILENQNSNFIKTMSYRLIRLFITLNLKGMLMLASVVAEFILDQVFLSEDLDNSVIQKIEELIATREKIDSISEKFSNTVKPSKETKPSEEDLVDTKDTNKEESEEELPTPKVNAKEDVLSMLFESFGNDYDPDSLDDFDVEVVETKSIDNFSDGGIFKRRRK